MPAPRLAVALALAVPLMGAAALLSPPFSPIQAARAADEAPKPAQPKPMHVRGTLTAVDGHTITVKTTRGQTVPLMLTDKTALILASKADLSAIKPGTFVGITSVEEDGKRVAREVHVFAESLRGVGVGHYPWDLEGGPNMMTNGNVAKVSASNGDVLQVEYPGGEQTIDVPPDVTVVSMDKTTADQLQPGRQVFLIIPGAVEPDAKVGAVVVGADGVKPPM